MFNTANSYTLTIPETAAYLESVKQQPSFPPYNLLKRDGKYYMEMALAGYQEESWKSLKKKELSTSVLLERLNGVTNQR